MESKKTSYLLHTLLQRAYLCTNDLALMFNIKLNPFDSSAYQLSVLGDLDDDTAFITVCLKSIIQCTSPDTAINIYGKKEEGNFCVGATFSTTVDSNLILPLLSRNLQNYKHDSFNMRHMDLGNQKIAVHIIIPTCDAAPD